MTLSFLNFYVTVGRGTENFAECEIRNKFSATTSTQTESETHPTEAASLVNFSQVRDGKIIFRIPSNTDGYLDKILSLKCVERAFVAITDYENNASGKRDFLNQLMQTMSATQSFATAQIVLDQLSSVLNERKRKPSYPSLSKVTNTDDEPLRKVARLDSTALTDGVRCHELQQSIPCWQNHALKHDATVEDEKHYKTFRMSVKCSGKGGKWINVKKLSKDLAWRISKACGWSVELKNSDFEISLHISDKYVTAGIPLTSKPLSKRPFIMDSGLRAPVAWIMMTLADIKCGDIILDPMCGKGTLLLEACSNLKDACYIGVDRDSSQIEAARLNVHGMDSHNRINVSLFHADGLGLPLKPGSVDKVLCDAPFNQNHFTSTKPDEFFDSFLKEMYRIIRNDGQFVLLTSQEFSSMLLPLLQTSEDKDNSHASKLESRSEQHLENKSDKKSSFRLVSKHYMKLGETDAEIIVMVKS